MTRRTSVLEAQPSLWDDELPPATATISKTETVRRTHAHPRSPRRNPEFRASPCLPECIVCGKPEHPGGLQHCWPRCTVLCQHVAQPQKTDVCLITVRVVAEVRTSPYSGHTVAVVDCPHCDKPHQHTPTPGVRYAIAGCRLPYIVRTAERSTPWS